LTGASPDAWRRFGVVHQEGDDRGPRVGQKLIGFVGELALHEEPADQQQRSTSASATRVAGTSRTSR